MADDEEDEVPKLPTLEAGETRDRIMGLFEKYDHAKNGMIPLDKIKKAGVSVGPTENKILNTLAAMDFNGDGFIEASEWELYFAATVEALSADELDVVLGDLEASNT